jgi:GAF domain-containing protein
VQPPTLSSGDRAPPAPVRRPYVDGLRKEQADDRTPLRACVPSRGGPARVAGPRGVARWRPRRAVTTGAPPTAIAAQRATVLRAAERHSALLAAVAHAAEVLTRTPDLPQALAEAGRVLGEAAGVDRVNVMRYDHAAHAGFLYAEWARVSVAPVSQIDPGPYGYADYAEVWRPLLAGEIYHSPLPEKTGVNAALNVASKTKTDLFVPVSVEGRLWGALNFDDCTTERAWTGGEIDVLRTAAAAVAAAVRREELERERARLGEARVAELARRNALLVTAADASRVLIDAVDFGAACDRVLATLGPALDADRAALGILTSGADGGAPWCELTHEWTAPGGRRARVGGARLRRPPACAGVGRGGDRVRADRHHGTRGRRAAPARRAGAGRGRGLRARAGDGGARRRVGQGKRGAP